MCFSALVCLASHFSKLTLIWRRDPLFHPILYIKWHTRPRIHSRIYVIRWFGLYCVKTSLIWRRFLWNCSTNKNDAKTSATNSIFRKNTFKAYSTRDLFTTQWSFTAEMTGFNSFQECHQHFSKECNICKSQVDYDFLVLESDWRQYNWPVGKK